MSTFKIKQAGSGKGYVFNLVAGNGQVVCTSQVYSDLDSCKAGVESVRKNSVKAAIEDQTKADFKVEKNPKWELYIDKSGDHYRFRLKAANGQDICASQGYKARAYAMRGIESVKTNAPVAKIVVED